MGRTTDALTAIASMTLRAMDWRMELLDCTKP